TPSKLRPNTAQMLAASRDVAAVAGAIAMISRRVMRLRLLSLTPGPHANRASQAAAAASPRLSIEKAAAIAGASPANTETKILISRQTAPVATAQPRLRRMKPAAVKPLASQRVSIPFAPRVTAVL